WTNVVLLTFFSFLPGVSGWGHLGGALAGAAAALVLHYQRFGPAVFRVLGPVALVPLVWYPYHYLHQVGPRGKVWKDAEVLVFRDEVLRPMNAAMREASASYRDVVKPVRDRHPERREPEQLQAANAAIEQQLGELNRLIARLEARKFRDEEEEDARHKA